MHLRISEDITGCYALLYFEGVQLKEEYEWRVGLNEKQPDSTSIILSRQDIRNRGCSKRFQFICLAVVELHCIYCIVYCKSVTHGAFTFFFHILHIDENYLSQCQKEIIIHNVAQCNSTKCW